MKIYNIMNLTSLYKSIKISQKSIMWIVLLLVAIITIPLLTRGFNFFSLKEGVDGSVSTNDSSPDSSPNDSIDLFVSLAEDMDEEAARIEASQQTANLQTSIAENQSILVVIENTKTGIATIEGDISSFNTKLLNIKTKITEIEPLVTLQTQLETTITISEIESDITASEAEKIANTSTMSTKLKSIQGDIATFKSDVDSVLTKIETIDTQLIELI